jgi:hypothetical protein
MILKDWLVQDLIPKCNTWVWKWYIKCKKYVSQYMIVDINVGIAFSSQKTRTSFAYLHAGIA